jgi:hypothetical protein
MNGNIVGVDPLLGPLASNGGPTQTHALCTGPGMPDASCTGASPAICANPPVNGIDQRGYARPGSGHTQCSIGAYEADAIPCTGDCDGNAIVAINELVLGVNIALGLQTVEACRAWNSEGRVRIAQLVKGVNNALHGCGG